jgi:hypothetical protein
MGLHTTTRIITGHPGFGGRACPALLSASVCNNGPCPVDCAVSLFGTWSECSKSCGGGSQSRGRKVLHAGNTQGVVCPFLHEVGACGTGACPIDCIVSTYSAWDRCSASCGSGYQRKRRVVSQSPSADGKGCPVLMETRVCNTATCATDCVVLPFSSWSDCSTTCGVGAYHRTRDIEITPSAGGAPCPGLVEHRKCSLGPCPVNCVVSPFSAWGSCSKSCSWGTQVRSRSIISHLSKGRFSCPFLSDTRACSQRDCCIFTWQPWGACSKTCGVGVQRRAPVISVGLKACKPPQTKQCEQPCARDCRVSVFSIWSACSVSCGGGVHSRTRSIIAKHTTGGKVCPVLNQISNCGSKVCPVVCNSNKFSSWESCSRSCGSGYQSRTMEYASGEMQAHCPARNQTRACNTKACAIDCLVSNWTAWSTCSLSCLAGVQHRYRSTDQGAAFGGKPCPTTSSTKSCISSAVCPVDCSVSAWSRWTSCTKTCGSDTTRQRSRSVTKTPQHGGFGCPNLRETGGCKVGKCAVDCVTSPFGSWSSCSHSCGGGKQMRIRSMISHAQHGGYTCPMLGEIKECGETPCPEQCAVSAWVPWSPCAVSCGTGRSVRWRSVTRAPAAGGSRCPALLDARACSTATCPVDCQISSWGNWGDCSTTCSAGTQARFRSANVMSVFGGKPCPALRSTRTCHPSLCTHDCKMSVFTDWSVCPTVCANTSRTRTVVKVASGSGNACPALSESKPCGACAHACVVSSWTDWGVCTRTCGGGKQWRHRAIVTQGKVCPYAMSAKRECQAEKCAGACKVGDWRSWSACSRQCGSGTKVRSRQITALPSAGGMPCPALDDNRVCVVHHCQCDAAKCGVTKHWATAQRIPFGLHVSGIEQNGVFHTSCKFNPDNQTCDCHC